MSLPALPTHVAEAAARLELGDQEGAPAVRRRMGGAVAVAVLGVALAGAPLMAGWRGPALLLGTAVFTLPGLLLLGGATWGIGSLVRFGPVTAYPFAEGLVVARSGTADDMAVARWEHVKLASPDPRHPDDVRVRLGEGRPRTVPPALLPVLAAHVPAFLVEETSEAS